MSKFFLPNSKKCFIVVVLINVYLTVNAQIKRLNLHDGLSNNSITAVYEDRYGFMWAGTFDGLNRYDGHQFKIFKNKLHDTLSLPNNRISAIQEDGDGALWIGTKRGVYRLNQIKWEFLPLYYQFGSSQKKKKLTNPVNGLLKSNNGALFICTAGEGLLLKENGTNVAVQIPLDDKKKQYLFHAQSAVIDQDNTVWIFIQNVGLTRYNTSKRVLEVVNRAISHANCLLVEQSGDIFLGNNNGLYKYEMANKKPISIQYYASVGNSPIMSLSVDKQSQVWVGSDGAGVFQIDPRTEHVTKHEVGDGPENLSSAAVYAVYVDKTNRKWIGTLRGGLNIIDKSTSRFTLIQRNTNSVSPLSSNFILSFCEENDQKIWIGTDGAGISLWHRLSGTFENYKYDALKPNSLSNNNVVNIVKDNEGSIWIATYGGGINKLDPKTKKFKRYACFNASYGYEEVNVWALYKDSKGTIWAGALSDGGLYRFNKTADYFELVDNRVTNLLTLMEDEAGQLWGGNFNSLVKIDLVNKNHVWYKVGSAVRAIKTDRKGHLWVGTEGAGLKFFDKQRGFLKTYSEVDGLPENAVLNILEGEHGRLWLSTFNGLSEFSSAEDNFRNFFTADGLQSNQFNYNAALELSTGELLFGGINGFNIFDPKAIKPLSDDAPTLITGIRINNNPIELSDLNFNKQNVSDIQFLRLPHDKAVLSVDFAKLDYSFQDKINYAFYLEGWEENWNYVGHSRSANYGKLPSGSYTLHIKASDADGVWDEEERLLFIKVSPPWWATWWAYSAYAFLVLFLIFVYHRYRKNASRLRYEIDKATLEKEKEHELNEKKTAFFTHISHELRTPLTLIINPIRQLLLEKKGYEHETLQVIFRNSKRLLSMVDQLLLFKKADSHNDSLKIARLNVNEICKEVYQCYQLQAAQQQIDFKLATTNELQEVYADREKVEIILFNLLANAFKFTPYGGYIGLKVSCDQEKVHILVEDSGAGVADELKETLFDKFARNVQHKQVGFGIGLFLSKKFAELHRGTLTFHNKETGGATFVLSLLAGKEHWTNRLIYEDIDSKSIFLEELLVDVAFTEKNARTIKRPSIMANSIVENKPSMMIIDDHKEIGDYLCNVFEEDFSLKVCYSAEEALMDIHNCKPQIILCDVMMDKMDGLQFCKEIKTDKNLRHIPIIMLTASSSEESKLRGIELGADDYISKPFNQAHLTARVRAILRQKKDRADDFYEEITLSNQTGISKEDVKFLQRCEQMILEHLHEGFTIKELSLEIGMSHSALYKKIKNLSGRTANEFMRLVKLRKAAQTLLKEEVNINEVTIIAGFNDVKYFREQFQQAFGMTPSEYVRTYRTAFQKKYQMS
ncbi:hybrid sensor histidine kinase/response regulator transcription factor [Olivibacter domesticus]|uniref:histidine kinase n=1 Tax=Olivibacter domesticus TaxID=407022 RepID=A0A1H7TN59_OLID1|nr:two-component regulator propeller domain-containing protein [Olivibacter domesticus]SEL85894.1 Two component regulator propeller [Olivibacter domesticus]